MGISMKYFLSFMGYPRSGHSLVAAILNAHPNVICSNQLHFYGKIDNLTKESLFNKIIRGSSRTIFKDTIDITPSPKKEILVIGDKTGHRTTTFLENNPQKLGVMKNIVGIPIKWIHVVRNPYDTLATWGRLNYRNAIRNNQDTTKKQKLDDVIQKYRQLNETIRRLRRSEDVLTVNHEFLITRMHNTLLEISNFLEIDFDPEWRDNIRKSVWNKPRITRHDMQWSTIQKKAVDQMTKEYSWLNGYVFGGCGGCGRPRKERQR
jgi:hypothetical protein